MKSFEKDSTNRNVLSVAGPEVMGRLNAVDKAVNLLSPHLERLHLVDPDVAKEQARVREEIAAQAKRMTAAAASPITNKYANEVTDFTTYKLEQDALLQKEVAALVGPDTTGQTAEQQLNAMISQSEQSMPQDPTSYGLAA